MTEGVYFSFIEQALHYFTRPHEHIASEPVLVEAAWRGGQMPSLEEMAYRLNAIETEEILIAVRNAAALDKDTRALTAADFPLPTLERQISQWRQALAHGLGFQVIRGVPVDRWTQEEAELF
ncbi:MAG: hypothetical protein AAGF35_09140, partial [Pseudomonadota bacterium]